MTSPKLKANKSYEKTGEPMSTSDSATIRNSVKTSRQGSSLPNTILASSPTTAISETTGTSVYSSSVHTNSNSSILSKHFSIQLPSSISQSTRRISTQLQLNRLSTIASHTSHIGRNSTSENCPKLNILSRLKQLALLNKGIITIQNVSWCHKYNKLGRTNWSVNDLKVNNDGNIYLYKSNPVSHMMIFEDIRSCIIEFVQDNLIIKVVNSLKNDEIYLKFKNFDDMINFLSILLVWSHLHNSSILSKWNYSNSMAFNTNLKPNDIIICRFKVYGPIKNNLNIKYDKYPINPIYPTPQGSELVEGWFTVIGHLLPTGILNLVSETDGSLIYSVNITMLYESEIRLLNESVLQTSNVLYLGKINELRLNHRVLDNSYSREKFIIGIENNVPIARILIDFDLRIDLEDWYVALLSFSKLEYVGIKTLNSSFDDDDQVNLKVNKNVTLEIMEARFTDKIDLKDEYLYCELELFGTSWIRTAIVRTDFKNSTFWKELITSKIPMFNENDLTYKILIKKSRDKENYNFEEVDDNTVGVCIIKISKRTNENKFLTKILIKDPKNEAVLGDLMINLNIEEINVLPSKYYKHFEKMLNNVKINEIISYFISNSQSTAESLEAVSGMLLDIYQSLNKEDEYLETLMKTELINNEKSPANIGGGSNCVATSTNNKFSTIFRGNSLLSKSLEKYTLRFGHEYLEKLLGPFILKIQNENLNCECDPRYEPEDYKENYSNLLNYIEYLWDRIYKTTNDIPIEMKTQWKNLRINVEMATIDSDYDANIKDKDTKLFDDEFERLNGSNMKTNNKNEISLNALSAFIFLRFLCPAILSPKLYNLSKIHYSGRVSRTLVLIAKVLMIFANRSSFAKHKDPYLMDLNEDFLNLKRQEMLIYFDKVTLRKMDFNDKLLDMSNKLDRIQLNTSEKILKELPTMPFLIDKYSRFSQLVTILGDETKTEKGVNARNEYQIEEFDKFQDEEDFLVSVSNEDAFADLIKRHYKMKDLQEESVRIVSKGKKFLDLLELGENPTKINDWNDFVDNIIRSCRLKGNTIIYDSDVYRDKRIRLTKETERKFDLFFDNIKKIGEKKLLEEKCEYGSQSYKSMINRDVRDNERIDALKQNKIIEKSKSNKSLSHSTSRMSIKNDNKPKRSLFSLFKRKSSIQ